MDLLHEIESPYLKRELPHFQIGDTLEIRFLIREGDKERLQSFIGTLIRRRGSGIRETITVRRIVDGEGVERIFPLHSPKIGEIVVRRHGKVRRAKLYYLRERIGKATKVKEEMFRDRKMKDKARRRKSGAGAEPDEAPDRVAAEADAASEAAEKE
jgi:large subunit ribosomal protein L19